MKILKGIICVFILAGCLLSGCQKSVLKLRQDEFVVELGEPIITDVSCYLDMSELDTEQQEDILSHAKLTVEHQTNEFKQLGTYQATIEYKKHYIQFSFNVQDTQQPVLHGPSVLYVQKGQTIDYNKKYILKDQSQTDIQFDDHQVNLNEVGEYPVFITANDSQHSIKKTITVKVGSQKAISLPQSVHLDIPYYNQLDASAPNGCEATSLYMALKYKKKINVDLTTFIKNQPKGDTPYLGFSGDPFSVGKDRNDYYAIFPSALARYGENYNPCYDISGYSLQEMKEQLANDHPIVVWLTSGMNDVKTKDYYFGHVTSNLHIILLSGYDDNQKLFHILDPIDKTITSIDYEQFQKIYSNMQFSMSVS